MLAIVCESLPPYRVHLHRRIVREIPEVRLATLCTHDPTDGRWEPVDAPELNTTVFSQGESTLGMRRLRNLPHEWRKAGRVVAFLRRAKASSAGLAAVLVHGYSDILRLRVLRWCRRHGVPVFITGDSNVVDDRATGWRRAIKRAFVGYVVRNLADGVMPFGSRGAAYFRRYGVRPEQIFFVPLEPDYAQFAGAAPGAAVAALQFDPRRRRLLYSGRLVGWKRVDLLIDAFTAIADERKNWDLVIVGDGPERKALQARVPSALSERVIWAGGFRAATDVAALYGVCDVLVLPSDREPWALVINEAAAAGLAIVSSDVPGAAAELVRDQVNGRIFPRGDLQALTAALSEVTAPDRIDALKAASANVLADWRRRGDPVRGLRRALRCVGISIAETG